MSNFSIENGPVARDLEPETPVLPYKVTGFFSGKDLNYGGEITDKLTRKAFGLTVIPENIRQRLWGLEDPDATIVVEDLTPNKRRHTEQADPEPKLWTNPYSFPLK